MLSMGSKCRSYTVGVRSPSLMNLMTFFKNTYPFPKHPKWVSCIPWVREWFPWTLSSFSLQDLMSPGCFDIFHFHPAHRGEHLGIVQLSFSAIVLHPLGLKGVILVIKAYYMFMLAPSP